jgi:hypothetical protein
MTGDPMLIFLATFGHWFALTVVAKAAERVRDRRITELVEHDAQIR